MTTQTENSKEPPASIEGEIVAPQPSRLGLGVAHLPCVPLDQAIPTIESTITVAPQEGGRRVTKPPSLLRRNVFTASFARIAVQKRSVRHDIPMRAQFRQSWTTQRAVLLARNTADFQTTNAPPDHHLKFLLALLGEARRQFQQKMLQSLKKRTGDPINRYILEQRMHAFEAKIDHLLRTIRPLLQEDDDYCQATFEIARGRLFHVFVPTFRSEEEAEEQSDTSSPQGMSPEEDQQSIRGSTTGVSAAGDDILCFQEST